MLWAVALAITLASGWFLARGLAAGSFNGPRWASLLTELSLGALFGPGIASILCLALVSTGAAKQAGAFAVLAAFLGVSAAIWWSLRPDIALAAASSQRFPWT